MLPSVLSGVRDLRSALIVGYIWLIGLWLAITSWWPTVADLRGHASAGLLVLADLFGQAGSVAAVTVAALVLGQVWIASVSSVVTGLARYRLRHSDLSPVPHWLLFCVTPLTHRAQARLLRRTEASFGSAPDPAALRDRTVLVFSESLLMAPRLIVAKPELYEEHKRLRQDADLLYALLLPTPLLGLTLLAALGAGPTAWALGIPALIVAEAVLLIQAAQQFRNAMSMLAHFVADGLITTPGLIENETAP
jgi:hypothetical protein